MRKGTVVAFLLGAIVFGVAVGVARYRECRAIGFSAFYCLTN